VKTVGTVGTVGTIGKISKIKTGGVASIFHENITVTYSFSLTHLNPCIDNLIMRYFHVFVRGDVFGFRVQR
jgi:hypothetical protein